MADEKFGPALGKLLRDEVIEGYFIFTYDKSKKQLEPVLVVDKTKELEKSKTVQKMLSIVPLYFYENFLFDQNLDIQLADHTKVFYGIWEILQGKTFIYIYQTQKAQLIVVFTSKNANEVLEKLLGIKSTPVSTDYDVTTQQLKISDLDTTIREIKEYAIRLEKNEKTLNENIKYITEAIIRLAEVISNLRNDINKMLKKST
ncbi:MAG: hypothetical protein ACP6IU_02690 [Candidatus Asgardarchaeia archaeon]|nr:hypothetical protein [Candidatus Odinarchaeota archaeon]